MVLGIGLGTLRTPRSAVVLFSIERLRRRVVSIPAATMSTRLRAAAGNVGESGRTCNNFRCRVISVSTARNFGLVTCCKRVAALSSSGFRPDRAPRPRWIAGQCREFCGIPQVYKSILPCRATRPGDADRHLQPAAAVPAKRTAGLVRYTMGRTVGRLARKGTIRQRTCETV